MKKPECYHTNYRDIFNSEIGCAYCMDCGKSPLSVQDIGQGILKPGFDKLIKQIEIELVLGILSKNNK